MTVNKERGPDELRYRPNAFGLVASIVALIVSAGFASTAQREVEVSAAVLVLIPFAVGGAAGYVSSRRAGPRGYAKPWVAPRGSVALVTGVALMLLAGPAWLKAVVLSAASGGLFVVGWLDPLNWRRDAQDDSDHS